MNIVSAGLLLFWGIYFSLAGIGNVFDWLTQHGHKGRFFRFSSKNYELLERVAERHGAGKGVMGVLFATIMLWELLSAAAYISALALYTQGLTFLAQYSFFIGMGLFAGLVLGNEVFIYYDDEEEHVVMFLAQLISYMAFTIL